MALIIYRVRRTDWIRLTQDQLPVYAGNVFTLTNANPAYTAIQSAVTALGTANTSFIDLLREARNGNHSVVADKDMAKQALLTALGAVADGLEYNAGADPMYILNAGMQQRRSRTQHLGDLLPVTGLDAVSNGIDGQAHLTFRCPAEQRSQIETFAVEWSQDEQQTWHNGTYKNSERITVKDLPGRKDIWFRVRCLGTRSRESPWSAVDSTFVL